MPEAVRFSSGGVACGADLYVPPDFDATREYPAVVLGHGTGQSKESLVQQAGFFSRAGYVALAIDYRSFGASEGEPRGQLFPLDQVEDFHSGISFLDRVKGVAPGRIGIWGTSNSGGVVIQAAAMDRRVKAVVAQIPVVDHYRWMRWLRSAAEWTELLDRVDQDRQLRFDTGRGARIPRSAASGLSYRPLNPSTIAKNKEVLRKTGKPLMLPGAADVTLESIEKALEFSAVNVIDRIAPRALCIIATKHDDAHPLEQTLEAFARAREPKHLVMLDMTVLDVYWEPGLSLALTHAVEFYDRCLKG